jgi:hypothetical protein
VDTLKFVLTAVLFEAVVLPKMTSRPGDEVGNDAMVPAAVPKPAGGPSRNAGNPKLVVFVNDGVTFEMVTKLSG